MAIATSPTTLPIDPADPELDSADRRPRLWVRTLVSVVGGFALTGAFPPFDLWLLAIAGPALILWSLRGITVPGALLVGAAGGFAFYGSHIIWLTTYLGLVPWLALAGVQTLFFAIAAVGFTLIWRWSPLVSAAAVWRVLAVPLIIAGFWTAREAVTSTWPYGGFSWGRLSFAQSESPLGELAAWVGASGLSFVVALIAAMLVVSVMEVAIPRLRVIPAFALMIALFVPAWPVETTGELRVAAVQGDADAGLFAERGRGDILQSHYEATLPILDEEFDLLVWPENAADIDPLRYPQGAVLLDSIAQRAEAPMVVGTITVGEEDEVFNSALVWKAGEGAVAQYDKIHPVPFAEYLPDRDFWYPLAPDLFDLIPRDYSIGQRPNVVDIPLESGDTLEAGIAICFDIVDDAAMRQMIDGGAEIILAPTNNADFGQSSESVQQLAIARLRAIEYGRTVVNISTVATSAIIGPDGSTIAELPTFEPGAMVETVPLSTVRTPAADIGLTVERIAIVLGLAGLALGAVAAARSRRNEAAAEPESGPTDD